MLGDKTLLPPSMSGKGLEKNIDTTAYNIYYDNYIYNQAKDYKAAHTLRYTEHVREKNLPSFVPTRTIGTPGA